MECIGCGPPGEGLLCSLFSVFRYLSAGLSTVATIGVYIDDVTPSTRVVLALYQLTCLDTSGAAETLLAQSGVMYRGVTTVTDSRVVSVDATRSMMATTLTRMVGGNAHHLAPFPCVS